LHEISQNVIIFEKQINFGWPPFAQNLKTVIPKLYVAKKIYCVAKTIKIFLSKYYMKKKWLLCRKTSDFGLVQRRPTRGPSNSSKTSNFQGKSIKPLKLSKNLAPNEVYSVEMQALASFGLTDAGLVFRGSKSLGSTA
jgi:hypothetical protein